jgi:hypothetical protein
MIQDFNKSIIFLAKEYFYTLGYWFLGAYLVVSVFKNGGL